MQHFASDRQRASIERAERERDRMLMAGPPEPPTFTVTYKAEGFSELQDASVQKVADWLRTKVQAKDAKVSAWLDEADNTVYFEVEGDTLEEVTDEDRAESDVIDMLGGGPHKLVLDFVEVTGPEPDDEPDWDARAKDERAEREFDREHEG